MSVIIGYNDTYGPDGQLISHEPIEVSDDQAAVLAMAQDLNSQHRNVLRALAHWDQLTLAQKDQLLQLLAKFYLAAGERLGLFHVD